MLSIAKAKLQEIKWRGSQIIEVPTPPGKNVVVQFNPETVSLSYTAQKNGGDQRGGAAIQYSGPGTTKLSMDLLFDVNALEGEQAGKFRDVQKLTEEVVYFITPKKSNKGGKNPQYDPPGVRVKWGSFLFVGVMDSLSKKFSFFSELGEPLRASLSISITGQLVKLEDQKDGSDSSDDSRIGREPLMSAKDGETMPQMLQKYGLSENPLDIRKIAEANGIENLRSISPGMLINGVRGLL